jgi:hypothetical protein
MSSSFRVAVSPSSPKASLGPRDDASSSAGVDRCPEDVARRRAKGARGSEKAASSREGATSCRRTVSPSSNAAAPLLESDASCRTTAAVRSTPAAVGRIEASLSRATVGLARLEADFGRLVDAFCHQRAASSRTRTRRAPVADGAAPRNAAARRRREGRPRRDPRGRAGGRGDRSGIMRRCSPAASRSPATRTWETAPWRCTRAVQALGTRRGRSWIFSCRASIATKCSMRLARVSGFLGVWMRKSTE